MHKFLKNNIESKIKKYKDEKSLQETGIVHLMNNVIVKGYYSLTKVFTSKKKKVKFNNGELKNIGINLKYNPYTIILIALILILIFINFESYAYCMDDAVYAKSLEKARRLEERIQELRAMIEVDKRIMLEDLKKYKLQLEHHRTCSDSYRNIIISLLKQDRHCYFLFKLPLYVEAELVRELSIDYFKLLRIKSEVGINDPYLMDYIKDFRKFPLNLRTMYGISWGHLRYLEAQAGKHDSLAEDVQDDIQEINDALEYDALVNAKEEEDILYDVYDSLVEDIQFDIHDIQEIYDALNF